MLQIQLIGRLGKDAELVGKNKDIATFSVAVGKGEETQWFRCALFGKNNQPAGVAKFLSKGTQVYISGRPVLDVYKDKEGNDKIGTDIKVLVNQVELLGGLRTESGGNHLPQVAETDGDALPF
jgi:single-strand DNA-binding protein